MRNLLGIVFIIAAIVLGYFGYDKVQGSKAGIKIGNAEISATDSGKQSSGYLLLGAGGVLLIAGVVLIARSNKR